MDPAIAKNVMNRGGTPATTIIAATHSTMIVEVPRSGCLMMRANGTIAMTSSRDTSYMVRPSGLRAQNVAIARMIASTVNSLGWIWTKPRLYQRWAPSALWPRTKTPASPSSEHT